MRGQVPGDQPHWTAEGFVVDAGPDERRAMWESAVAALAALHGADAASFPFLSPPDGMSGLEHHPAYWRRWLDDTTLGPTHDTTEAGHEWLTANRPPSAPTALSWGDSRFANIMFDGPRVVALFDWDTVSMAGPVADLAWWRYMDGPASTLPGIGTADELVERGQDLIGRTAGHIEYYDVLTTFRLSCVLLRLFGQLGASGQLPVDVAEHQARDNAAVHALAAGLEAYR